jgi:hypothetical protein
MNARNFQMLQAVRTSTAPQEKLRETFDDLEGDLRELANMAKLAEDAVTDALGGDHKEVTGRSDFYYLPRQQVDATTFAVEHLASMIRHFAERYMAALKGAPSNDVDAAVDPIREDVQ